MLTVAAFQVLCYFIIFGFDQTIGADAATFDLLLGKPAFYPLAGFAGVGLRRLFDEQARQEAARRRAEIAATAAEERARLAREMHDSLAKTLRGIALSAAALPTWVRRDPARAKDEAERIASAMEIASREARGLITGLRDESVTRPLPVAVRMVVDKWGEESGIKPRCEIDQAADLPLRARYEALAILSEVLTNIDRHAEATTVEVSLGAHDEDITLSIRDDGRGFSHDAGTKGGREALARDGHYGLIGLHERADRIEANVTVVSAPGEGTAITVVVPLEASSSADDFQLAEVG
jgi:signal transduction histidine kinase